jgi:hypothetical protein
MTVKRLRKYNDNELLLLSFVPKGGKTITSAELVKLRKRAKRWTIAHPRNAMSITMRRLIAKIKHNHEPFRLCKSPRNGPTLTKYWMEKPHAS